MATPSSQWNWNGGNLGGIQHGLPWMHPTWSLPKGGQVGQLGGVILETKPKSTLQTNLARCCLFVQSHRLILPGK